MKKIHPAELKRKNVRDMQVEVRLPSEMHIELVQGNELRHYEVFFSLASISASVAVGFWIGYVTDNAQNPSLLWSALAFSGLAILSGITAFSYRRKVYNGSVTKIASFKDFK